MSKSFRDNFAAPELHFDSRKGLPSRSTPQAGCVWTWIKEKAIQDSQKGGSPNPGQLWMVHNKWYDLRPFVDRHPGGADWLRLTQGQDITEAYMVHHLNAAKVDAILNKYYVCDATDSYVGRYIWDDNAFYPVLKHRVQKLFGTAKDGMPDTGPTPSFLFMCSVAIIIHFLTFLFLLYMPSIWTAILAGFTLQTFHGIGHNALHYRDTVWRYAYDFCGWKHHRHRVSHALSHHLYPNTQLDLEHPEPYSYVFQSNGHHNSRWVIVIGPLAMWSGPLRDIFSLWIGLVSGSETFRPEFVFNMLQLTLLLAFNVNRWHGFLCFCIMHFVCGFCIECAGFGLHRSIFCWTDGDSDAKLDFGEHCLSATADHDVEMSLWTSLYCFQILNNHGIHHLFPTIDRSQMHKVMPVFIDTCREFGVPWQEYEWADMFGSLWKVWLRGLYTNTPMITTPARGHPIIDGSSLRILPLHADNSNFGAVVSGVQAQHLTKQEMNVVKRAWEKYGVLVFRNQKMTVDQEVAFALNFPHHKTCDQMRFCGPLAKEGFDADEWRKFKLKSRPEIQLRGYAQLDDYYGVTGLLNTGKGALEYHSDSLHEYDTPPIFTALFCHSTPGGDDTLFIDTRVAYNRLTPSQKDRVDNLFVQYRQEPQPLHKSGLRADFTQDSSTLGDLYGKFVDSNPDIAGQNNVQVSQVHPLVWTHPSTGTKAIICASMWMYRIVEEDGTPWTPEESHTFLHELLEPVEKMKYAHKWSAGDLVCFDNRSLMHSANATSKPKKGSQGKRLLHQILLCGDMIPTGPAGVGVGNPRVNPNIRAAR